MMHIQNLSKSFGSKTVLNDINILFEEGKVYGIVGENGAGKTTLFNCIAGLEGYDGRITSDHEKLKEHLGYLQTNPYFFSKITGREYLQLCCIARGKEDINFDSKNIFELPLDDYASIYSTGMQKKLALTAILLQENSILILDEPFNGVDIQSNMIITGIIQQLRSLGKTILISSHIFSTLSDTCDEIHLLRSGVFIKKALKSEFNQLDAEMKSFIIGNKLELLGLK